MRVWEALFVFTALATSISAQDIPPACAASIGKLTSFLLSECQVQGPEALTCICTKGGVPLYEELFASCPASSLTPTTPGINDVESLKTACAALTGGAASTVPAAPASVPVGTAPAATALPAATDAVPTSRAGLLQTTRNQDAAPATTRNLATVATTVAPVATTTKSSGMLASSISLGLVFVATCFAVMI